MKKVFDVIFGLSLLIGLMLLVAGIGLWLATLKPYDPIMTTGAFLVVSSVIYAQIGERNVDMDGGYKR